MIIPTLFLLLISSVHAQIPTQPIATTNSACLNTCLQQGSVVFAANNLRNFQKIATNIKQFCDAFEKLVACAATCTIDERYNLSQLVMLAEYMCKDKVEEFRLVHDCVSSHDNDIVEQCANTCQFPVGATVQLDSSPSAAVNPFAFFDSITPVCRSIECTIKCSIKDSNQRCAGSGDILRDVGLKQVLEASERLHNDVSNSSSSVAQQLATIYLQSLPGQCAFVINPVRYDTVFTTRDENSGSELLTSVLNNHESSSALSTSVVQTDENTVEQKSTLATLVASNEDVVITRIVDVKIQSQSTAPSASTSLPSSSTASEISINTSTVDSEEASPDDQDKESAIDETHQAIGSSTEAHQEHVISPDIDLPELPIESVHSGKKNIGDQEKSSTDSEKSAADKKLDENIETSTDSHSDHMVTEHEHSDDSSSSHEITATTIESKVDDQFNQSTSAESNDITEMSTERTILVVNEENEHQLATNEVEHQHETTIQPISMAHQVEYSTISLIALLITCFIFI